jgi:hypothetical protein
MQRFVLYSLCTFYVYLILNYIVPSIHIYCMWTPPCVCNLQYLYELWNVIVCNIVITFAHCMYLIHTMYTQPNTCYNISNDIIIVHSLVCVLTSNVWTILCGDSYDVYAPLYMWFILCTLTSI